MRRPGLALAGAAAVLGATAAGALPELAEARVDRALAAASAVRRARSHRAVRAGDGPPFDFLVGPGAVRNQFAQKGHGRSRGSRRQAQDRLFKVLVPGAHGGAKFGRQPRSVVCHVERVRPGPVRRRLLRRNGELEPRFRALQQPP